MANIARLLALVVVACITSTHAQTESKSGYLQHDPKRKEVIVFVHGVTGDAKETWTHEQTKAYWPSLVREDGEFAAANVWVYSYFSPKLGAAQNISELATKFGDELRAQDVFRSHERMYFLVHSMGGLITREMLAQQLPPPKKVPLIYFFGTPSAGAESAGIVAAVTANPQFENMRPFTRESNVAAFSKRWLATAENASYRYPQRVWSFCAYEIEPFAAGKLIVSQASASFLCSTAPRASVATHVTMVKPASRSSEPYQYFLSAYKFARSEAGRLIASADAITLHSPANPGVRTEGIEVRTAKLGNVYGPVGCSQTSAGKKEFKVDLAPGERLIAVKPALQEKGKLEADLLGWSFDPTGGSITVDYSLRSAPADAIHGCPPVGHAESTVKYLVENR